MENPAGNVLIVWTNVSPSACEKEAGSILWIYVLVGNMLRGIGETPIMPLGISYLDDFSREENTPFYLGLFVYVRSLTGLFFFWLILLIKCKQYLPLFPACIHTVGILGPMFGFMLGSFLSKIYVDIGFVDLGTVEIIFLFELLAFCWLFVFLWWMVCVCACVCLFKIICQQTCLTWRLFKEQNVSKGSDLQRSIRATQEGKKTWEQADLFFHHARREKSWNIMSRNKVDLFRLRQPAHVTASPKTPCTALVCVCSNKVFLCY